MGKKRIFALVLLLLLLAAQGAFAQQELAKVYIVHEVGCPACAALEPYLEQLEQKYAGRAEFVSYEINESAEEVIALQQSHNVPVADWLTIPKVFAGDYYCIGTTKCTAELDAQIERAIQAGGDGTGNGSAVKISGMQLIGLALVDAINPCEMAVLIILLTAILIRYPDRKIKALYAGLAFALAIFLVYFAMGLLIIFGFKSVAAVAQVNTPLLHQLLGALAIVLGLLNIKDYVKFGAGGFVMEVPRGWRPKMQEVINKATSVAGAFAAGLIVSLFLTPCTSGPYFVAAGILAGVDWLAALPWLLLYNAIFIAPMIAITLAVYRGFVAIGDVAGWREKNIKRMHLAAGLILVALGIALVLGFV